MNHLREHNRRRPVWIFALLMCLLSVATTVRGQEQSKNLSSGVPDETAKTARDVHWPSFRGRFASGVADQQNLPIEWDARKGKNIRWKTPIPGLAHSSPIVWGDKLFVTSAVSGEPTAETIRHGLYGDGTASSDQSVHRWILYCLEKKSGRIVWERQAHTGVPRSKRHIKATYANCTPVTDGRFVIAHFGAEGLFAFDMDGNRLWKKDLGDLDVGAYDAPGYEWGPASSPIIYRNLVIVQCDTQGESFILACDIRTGATVWRTARDELPSWGTPTIFPARERTELVTNGSKFIRGYDPLTGRELWRLGGSSKITAPTPIFADDLIIVCSGRRPEKPIFAIRRGASGDISLKKDETSNRSIAWSKTRSGPYMPTPIIYSGLLYTCQNNGVLTCYDVKSGEEKYRRRIEHAGGGFSASPVAADGLIFLPSEDGEVFVIKAGSEFQLMATNHMGEVLMATPALSEGTMYMRGRHHVFAIGQSKKQSDPK